MVKKRGLDRHSSHGAHGLPPLPAGIKVLIAYVSIIALFYLLYLLFGVTKPVSVFFGQFLYGTAATTVELTSLALLIAIIYGLARRHYWVFWISMVWFVFGFLNAVVSLLRFGTEFDALRDVLLTSSFVVIILNGIIAWYIYSERAYFKVKHLNKETRAKDKFFVYLISVVLIVSLLILVTFGIRFYTSTLKTTNKLVAELKDAPLPELHCAQKEGPEQDLCYLIVSVMREGKEPSICENIDSDFYKMTCYRSLQ
jgi:hypothetical protein